MDVFSDATLGERRIEWRPPIMQHGPWPKPTNIYAKRAGKLVIWRRVEALGAAGTSTIGVRNAIAGSRAS